jgi:CheY-like chemotaxis protein
MLSTRPIGTPIRVLVIAEDPRTGTLLMRGLAPTFDVDVETNPLDALACLLDASCYDVVLCDLQMPLFSGPEILAVARRMGVPLAERFVFMTDAARGELSEERHTFGRPVLRKPLSMVAVEIVLRGVVARGETWSRASVAEQPREQAHAG